jgi:hypothetical protein
VAIEHFFSINIGTDEACDIELRAAIFGAA